MNPTLVDHEFMRNFFNFGSSETFSNYVENQSYGEMFQKNNPPEIAPDFPEDTIRFISDILLEDGLDENPASVQDYIALQATEKSLYDALGKAYPFQGYADSPNHSSNSSKYSGSSHEIDSCYTTSSGCSFESNFGFNWQDASHTFPSAQPVLSSSSCGDSNNGVWSPDPDPVDSTSRNRSRQRDEIDQTGRGSKLRATANGVDDDQIEEYDDLYSLCSEYDGKKYLNFVPGGITARKGKTKGKKKNQSLDQADLRTLLMQCAQAVSGFDLRAANTLLMQIRQHANPSGDSIQRLAHYVAEGLEARLAATGARVSSEIVDVKVSASEFIKAYKLYISAIPFKRMSYWLANCAIKTLAEKYTKLHVIDFGIFLGLQWPCFIRGQADQKGGPVQLRITGIDFPQQGFRPSERVDATGRRLARYCEQFGVPFEYTGIAKRWEDIQPEDLRIESDELLIVNCLYRSGTLLDETVDANSPRDAFLRLVRKLNPALFIHGVVNGTFNAPFFVTRFKEALFHYSSVFEVFEATLPRESKERQLIEREVYAKEVYNLVACEGAERVQRPESCKLWQVRQARAGFKQVPLNQEHMSTTKAMVRSNYHKDFLVDENKHWMLQGWRGRTFCALSFWEPC